jgi:lysophospholipase L1-like esterase
VSAGVKPILIGFQPKNPLWVNFSLTDCIAYNNAIAAVATAKGVPFVDIYARWAAMRVKKTLIELTGDNHHHPNNYGSRAWFSAVLPYLLNSPVSSADLAAYLAAPT